MKNRYVFFKTPYTYTYVQFNNPLANVLTVGTESSTVDSLSISTDYTGPKPRPLTGHAHAFSKGFYQDFLGTSIDSTPGSQTIKVGVNGTFSGPPVYPAFTNTYNSALEQIYNGIRTQIDLSVDLAETKKTKDMLKNNLVSDLVSNKYASRNLILKNDSLVRQMDRQLKKQMVSDSERIRRLAAQHDVLTRKLGLRVGRFVDFVSKLHPKEWANRWLEYQYGWRPLVGAIYDTGKALMDLHTYSYVRVRGSGYDGSNINSSVTTSGITTVYSGRMQMRTRLVCEYRMSNSRIQTLAGYTSLNPVSIAWELLPYSFVIDWLVDVGGYLRNLESSVLFQDNFVRGYRVDGHKFEIAGSRSGGFTYNGGSSSYTVAATGFSRTSSKNRSILSSNPRPAFPSVNAKMGWQRVLSGVSLLAQHLK
jgi:hypothetical protein